MATEEQMFMLYCLPFLLLSYVVDFPMHVLTATAFVTSEVQLMTNHFSCLLLTPK